MPLLKVTTDGSGHAQVSVWSDAAAFIRPSYGDVHNLVAMSIVGPEQSIRGIAAGCALDNEYSRVFLTFSAGGRHIKARWGWGWPNIKAVLLATGALHLVAIGDSHTPDKGDASHLVVPSENTDDSLVAAIYDTLMAKYSTPLIPCDRTGQPPFERLSGKVWRKWVVSEVMRDSDSWKPCIPHPEQIDRSWIRAGVLSITQQRLDEIVSSLIKARRLTIPTPPEMETANV